MTTSSQFSRGPSLGALRIFQYAAHSGSFKTAAAALNITPAAVTKRIKQLECYYGVSLFLRSYRHVKLTAEGALLLRTVDEIFNKIAISEDTLRGVERHETLVILSEPDFAQLWLFPRLKSLSATAGGRLIELRTIAGDSNVEDADLIIHDRILNRSWFDTHHLNRAFLFPICSPDGDPSASVGPSNLQNHTFVHDRGYTEWARFRRPMNDSVALACPHQIVCDRTSSCLAAVEQGGALGIGDDLLAAEHVMSGRVVLPIRKFARSASSYYLHTPRSARRDSICLILQQWIIENVRESVRRTHNCTCSPYPL